MPASTRSRTKQATLEDVGAGNAGVKKPAKDVQKSSATSQAKTSRKRKTDSSAVQDNDEDKEANPSNKATKAGLEKSDMENSHENQEVITINRAPVLELWAASVTQLLHPKVSWQTCLSVGGAISTITAISKGRSIGTISKPDPGEAEEKRQHRREKADQENLDEVEVMSFHLRLDSNGHAIVGDKPRKPGEEALRKKFGEEAYEKARGAFRDALKKWKGKEDDLDGRAFGMYEDFRPTVPPGQKGWGSKGQLNLQTVSSVVGDS